MPPQVGKSSDHWRRTSASVLLVEYLAGVLEGESSILCVEGWLVCLSGSSSVCVCVCHCIEDSSANAVMKSARSTYAAAWF